jgi:hypothetical protein
VSWCTIHIGILVKDMFDAEWNLKTFAVNKCNLLNFKCNDITDQKREFDPENQKV